MAPLLPTPSGVLRIRYVFNEGAHTAFGSKHDQAYTGTAPTTSDMAELIPLLAGFYETHLVGLQSSDVGLNTIEIRDQANPSTVPATEAVTVDGTRAPGQDDVGRAACLIYRPDRSYRGSRPKSFWPWGIQADTTGSSQWASAFQSEVNTAWAAYQSAIAGTPFGGSTLRQQVGISYFERPYTPVTNPTTGRVRNVPTTRTPPLVTNILTAELTPVFGSQRRRLRSA
jgi:hypothetical protein